MKTIRALASPMFIEELKKTGTRDDTLRLTDGNLFYDNGTLMIICDKISGHASIADC